MTSTWKSSRSSVVTNGSVWTASLATSALTQTRTTRWCAVKSVIGDITPSAWAWRRSLRVAGSAGYAASVLAVGVVLREKLRKGVPMKSSGSMRWLMHENHSLETLDTYERRTTSLERTVYNVPPKKIFRVVNSLLDTTLWKEDNLWCQKNLFPTHRKNTKDISKVQSWVPLLVTL